MIDISTVFNCQNGKTKRKQYDKRQAAHSGRNRDYLYRRYILLIFACDALNSHSLRAKARHPKPARFEREAFKVGHITFEISDNPKIGSATYALIAGQAPESKARRPLFTGHVETGMATQLRRLAHRFDEIEDKNNG